MNVELKQAEIEIAIADYMRKSGVVNPVDSMHFVAGRRGNGVSVEITVSPNTTEVELGEPEADPTALIGKGVVGSADGYSVELLNTGYGDITPDITRAELSEFMSEKMAEQDPVLDQEPGSAEPESSEPCEIVAMDTFTPAEAALFTPAVPTVPAEEAQKEPHPLFG
jgi:hypothetical protein